MMLHDSSADKFEGPVDQNVPFSVDQLKGKFMLVEALETSSLISRPMYIRTYMAVLACHGSEHLQHMYVIIRTVKH